MSSLNDGLPLVDTILIHMGSMYTSLRMFDNVLLVYERGLKIIEKECGKCLYFTTGKQDCRHIDIACWHMWLKLQQQTTIIAMFPLIGLDIFDLLHDLFRKFGLVVSIFCRIEKKCGRFLYFIVEGRLSGI